MALIILRYEGFVFFIHRLSPEALSDAFSFKKTRAVWDSAQGAELRYRPLATVRPVDQHSVTSLFRIVTLVGWISKRIAVLSPFEGQKEVLLAKNMAILKRRGKKRPSNQQFFVPFSF